MVDETENQEETKEKMLRSDKQILRACGSMLIEMTNYDTTSLQSSALDGITKELEIVSSRWRYKN